MNSWFVSYLRVSTDKRGRSGLGLEAQREAVRAYVAKAGSALVEEVVEVESGHKAKRPQLARALALCRHCHVNWVQAMLNRPGFPGGHLVWVRRPRLALGVGIVARFGLCRGTLPMGSSRRRLLNQSTHSSVANSTASKLRPSARGAGSRPAACRGRHAARHGRNRSTGQ